MSETVREARERLRTKWVGDAVIDAAWNVDTDYCRDVARVLHEYLAEHPADEDEPITEEWLFGCGLDDVYGCMSIKGPDESCVSFLKSVKKVFVQGRGVDAIRTRRQFRLLCAALDIELKS